MAIPSKIIKPAMARKANVIQERLAPLSILNKVAKDKVLLWESMAFIVRKAISSDKKAHINFLYFFKTKPLSNSLHGIIAR